MSQFRKIVESILVNTSFVESEQKINWILSQPKLVQQLENRIKTDSKTPENITTEQLLRSFDNTSTIIGKFLPWVVKHYCNNEFEYTDLGLVNNYLENFTKSINKVEKKDINAYKSLDELISALDDIKDVKGTREKNRESKANAEKIYENNKWLILIPHTKEAAIQYGKGTRWCTAGITNNMFDYYNKKGPLYILINKRNPSEKYQFHFESGQFMDSEDDEIDLKSFLKENPEIRKFFRNLRPIDELVNENWIWFNPEELTKKDCLEAVKNDGRALEYVPEEFRDYNMCLEAVKNYGLALEFVPEQLKNYDMCLEAVKNYGLALRWVPEEFRDHNMYLEAVKNNGRVLHYVPEERRGYNMCLEAVKNYGYAIKDVPEEFRDRNMCLEAVKNDGYTLQWVREEYINYNMCLEAVKNYGRALEFVPEEFRDRNICLEAVKNDGRALEYVPEEFRDYNMCLEAVKNSDWALEDVPEELKIRIKQELGF